MTKTNETYESIDTGAKTDNFDIIHQKIVKLSEQLEPDIKDRLSVEKELAKYMNCSAQSAMLALNFMLLISNQHGTMDIKNEDVI